MFMWLWQLWFVFLTWVSHKTAEKIHLRSENEAFKVESVNDNIIDFVLPDTHCAAAADKNSADTIWFIKVKGSCEAVGKEVDDYGHQIAAGLENTEGQFMEKLDTSTKGCTHKLQKKKTFFPEFVVYPFV